MTTIGRAINRTMAIATAQTQSEDTTIQETVTAPPEITKIKGPASVELFTTISYEVVSYNKKNEEIPDNDKNQINWQYKSAAGDISCLCKNKTEKATLFVGNTNDINKTFSIYAYLNELSEKVVVKTKVINTVNIISRKSWEAREPIIEKGRSYVKIDEPLDKFYDTIVIHHAGNEKDFPTIKEIQDKHMDGSDPRADIGYHFAVDRYGYIYEARDIGILGAHVNKANTGKIGIVLLADLSTDDADMGVMSIFEWSDGELTDKMELSLLKLCAYLDSLYSIAKLGGHMEVNSDRACPGNLVMARINDWRKLLNKEKP